MKIWYGPIRRRIEPYHIFMNVGRMTLLWRQYGVAQGVTRIIAFNGSKVINIV